MPDVQKPTGEVADEVLNGMWPQWSESAFYDKAQAMLQLASETQRKAQSTQRTAQYTEENMAGQAYNAILTQLKLRTNEYTVHSDECARSAGWLKNMGDAIHATKTAMTQAVESHNQPHADYEEAMKKGVRRGGDAIRSSAIAKHKTDLLRAQSLVVDASGTMESAIDTGQAALAADDVPAPPHGTPAIPEEREDTGPGAEGMPQTDPTATAPTPGTTTTAGGGAGTTGGGSSSSGSGGSVPQAPAAALPPEMFAAPAAAAPAEAMSGSPASSPAASPADAAGGMPMSGMPMSGMPMQPPQMPAAGGAGQTPGNDLAKTVGD
ncbi:MAG: hypothetical protein E6Q55_06445, partial [Mycolicibacterium mageritense]